MNHERIKATIRDVKYSSYNYIYSGLYRDIHLSQRGQINVVSFSGYGLM